MYMYERGKEGHWNENKREDMDMVPFLWKEQERDVVIWKFLKSEYAVGMKNRDEVLYIVDSESIQKGWKR